MTRLYVGHLSEEVTEADLLALFASYGLQSIQIVTDDASKRARGFAFVYIEADPVMAVAATNGAELYGRNIVVKVVP